jgi:hypothetical protein
MKRPLPVLEPGRIRTPTRSFAWVDHRLRDRLHQLDLVDMALYLFLVLAADAQGVSCWRLDRIEAMLGYVPRTELFRARQRLIDVDLIAYRPWSEHCPDGSYQVLALR